ncbi:hypothetical protein H7R52_01855 [Weissella confusa]|uniref:Mur ligase central domain-containing protein n=1 Tax=Weissella confusa TaxID=1583 RepID=A0A923NCY7_WEICO|nr:hypothetical protein [Weissella confusa]
MEIISGLKPNGLFVYNGDEPLLRERAAQHENLQTATFGLAPTTTKDFIAAIGASTFKTVKTPANFNNEIGVPTTILSMAEDTELLVVEFGMDRPGDLTLLSELVNPDDGHDYIASAIANGATATLWQADHGNVPTDIPAIIVPDALDAFQKLAAYYLKKIAPKIVAISGSNGKLVSTSG